MRRRTAEPPRQRTAPLIRRSPGIFDFQSFLEANDVARRIATYVDSAAIYSQGDVATDVLYIQEGAVKLAVLSKRGKEAIVGILVQGDFFGEGCLAGQAVRMSSAS